jgi:hypothetical protein
MRRRGLFILLGLIILVVAVVGLMSGDGNMTRGSATPDTNAPPHAVDQ